LPTWAASFCLMLNSTSLVLSFSRTLALVFVVGALAVCGFFARRVLWRVTLLAVVLLTAVFVVRNVVDPDSIEARTTQIGKFGRVIEEVWITERMSRSQIDDNWRGYEAARALGQWAEGGPPRWLFGEGLGSLVDLGMFQTLTRDRRDAVRFIPIFHNGYMTVLVKTGLVGICLYLAFLVRLYGVRRRAGSDDVASPTYRLGRLMQACAATLAVSTAVWFGTFHKFDLLPVLLLIGFLLSQLAPGHIGAVKRRV
jgi:O-antigen ligase